MGVGSPTSSPASPLALCLLTACYGHPTWSLVHTAKPWQSLDPDVGVGPGLIRAGAGEGPSSLSREEPLGPC